MSTLKTKTSSRISTSALMSLALILFGATNIKAAPGDLDPTFSGDGKLTDGVGRANGVVIQPDGKLVVAGEANGNFSVARYNPDGSPDITFGDNGRVTTTFGLDFAAAIAVAAQPDGTDKLVPADYDGDGKMDQAVYRDGAWYVLGSQSGFTTFQFGLATDIPAPADYDGDGRTDAAVYRDGTWYLLQSNNGFSAVQFGLANDKPIPTAYLP